MSKLYNCFCLMSLFNSVKNKVDPMSLLNLVIL
jgi:hypothetical protein